MAVRRIYEQMTGKGVFMEKREETIRLWFDMWLKKRDFGILDLFSENAVYTESWGRNIMAH